MRLIVLTLAILASFGASMGYDGPDIHIKKVAFGISGTGTTTRYWDCCKPSCGWSENLRNKLDTPVASCSADGDTKIDKEIRSSCVGGTSYMCSDQQPVVVNDTFALGFAAGSFSGGVDNNYCCSCFSITFQGGLSGKRMVVQVTNTGGDLGSNQFDLAIPGGGVGIFTDGCSSQWGAPGSGWGDQYGGVRSEADCAQLPAVYQDGCKFRFEFMENVSNPPITFEQVECPSELTSTTGCQGLSNVINSLVIE
ncbi:hypothetical protein NQ314_007909 [Rhamnusium bicolor]|uniref:Cellulase n=1 Tax=Rhamnusium bicolor TaxID=1586634 RepID=A0AAV8YHT2_9CUCU|nr:hypothetical protein NQ314_007909 [Rhamnusium bicolor]